MGSSRGSLRPLVLRKEARALELSPPLPTDIIFDYSEGLCFSDFCDTIRYMFMFT